MNPITIGLCDDNAVHLNLLKEMLLAEASELELPIQKLLLFHSAKEMLSEARCLDILFLDVEMPEMDGIETGLQVRRIAPSCKIVMATSRIDRFKEAFQLQAIRFITKPYLKEEVRDALMASTIPKPGDHTILAYKDRFPHKIKEKDIIYATSFNGYVEIVTKTHVFRKDISLEKLEQELDTTLFVRVHRQHIVNLSHVKRYTDTTVYLEDYELPISKRKKRDFERSYIDYDLQFESSAFGF